MEREGRLDCFLIDASMSYGLLPKLGEFKAERGSLGFVRAFLVEGACAFCFLAYALWDIKGCDVAALLGSSIQSWIG